MLPKIKYAVKSISPKICPEIGFAMNFDGCSKGNPGLGGAGAVIYYNNDEIWSGTFFVGENATNNHAEYAGLILGLQQAIELDIKTLLVKGDSQLVLNHMTGVYKCKSPNLIELYNRAKELERSFDKISYEHVLRNFNKRADELSNIAVDNYLVTQKIKDDKNLIF
jgi:ribonuclease HI